MWNWPLVSTLTAPTMARVLYWRDLYELILNVPGEIFEFGTHFGSGAVTLANLRSLLEPRNQSRMIRIFDTFEGFSGVDAQRDGPLSHDGDFQSRPGWEHDLKRILALHEEISHWARPRPGFSIHKGDAGEQVRAYLSDRPATVISMAVFDMDIYKPTAEALSAVMPFMASGALLVFDEYACSAYPGETSAAREALQGRDVTLTRHPLMPYCAWGRVP